MRPRAWITLPGCNFNCRGCFAIARKAFGTTMTPTDLIDLLKGASKRYYGRTSLEEVISTGVR